MAARAGSDRSAAQPTPIWRCGKLPDSQATITPISAGVWAAASVIATRLTLARRDDGEPTSVEVAAISASSTRPARHQDPTQHGQSVL